jgi:hypothetical protein
MSPVSGVPCAIALPVTLERARGDLVLTRPFPRRPCEITRRGGRKERSAAAR